MKLKLILKLVMALAVSTLSVSCAVGPTVKLADGSIATLGGSVGTEATADARSLTMPNGMSLNWVRGNVNETAVLKTAIATVGTVAVANAAVDKVVSDNGVKTVTAKELTKQKGAVEATKQLGIKTTGQIEQAKILVQ